MPDHSPGLMSRAFVWLMCSQVAYGFGYSTFLILPKHLTVAYGAGPTLVGATMAAVGVANVLGMGAFRRLNDRVGRGAPSRWAICAPLPALCCF